MKRSIQNYGDTRKLSARWVVRIAMLDDMYIMYAEKKVKIPASGMMIIRDNLLVEKQVRHKKESGDIWQRSSG